MVFKLQILKLAEIEIDDAVAFYENSRKDSGKNFLIYLKGYFKILETNPELFQIKKQTYFR